MRSTPTGLALGATMLIAVMLVPAIGSAQTAASSETAGDAEARTQRAVAAAQTDADADADRASATERRVAVVALGEGARSGSVMQTLLGLLDADGFDVVGEHRLRRIMATHIAPKPPARVSAQFVGLTTRIGQGIEKFFYKGNEDALQILTPVFNLGMAYPEILARRPDLARQIFEAGLVMIRAYRNLGQLDDARRLARALVETFPGFDTPSTTVPPPVSRMLETQREALAEEGTRLKVEMVAGEGCQALVNGTVVDNASVVASARQAYYATMDCGGGQAPLWRVEAAKGRTTIAPIAPMAPLDYQMPNAGFRHRKLAEGYLRMIAFWADTPSVLGVADAAEESGEVVLVHVAGDGGAGWSDRADEKTVRRMLGRVMATYDGSPAAASRAGPARAAAQPVDWLSWSLVAGGVALAGLGSWGFYEAAGRADEIRCSPDSTARSEAGDCSGVPTVRFADANAFQSAKSEVNTVYGLSAASVAAGLALGGWGVYRLVSDEPAGPVAWGLSVTPRAVAITAQMDF